MSFSRSLQSDAYAVWGRYCSTWHFHMVEGLVVAMRSAGGEGWGRGGEGISYVVICCCGREMYCSALRLAPRISYIMSVQRCIFLLTGAMLPEMTYRKRTTQCFQCRKYHIIG